MIKKEREKISQSDPYLPPKIEQYFLISIEYCSIVDGSQNHGHINYLILKGL